eukprot:8127507-Ditylum_brightwellii.AAC.1
MFGYGPNLGMFTESRTACAGLFASSVSPGDPMRSPAAAATASFVPPIKPTLLDRPLPNIQSTFTCVLHQTLAQSLTTLVLRPTLPFLEERS